MRMMKNRQIIAILLLVASVLWVGAGAAWAQATPQPAEEATPNEASAPNAGSANDVSANDVNAVARELWCPLCSGVRLDACELKACEQMKDMIALQLAEGQDTETIKDYFVTQYGPQVLGEPPREGFNWLAWILPFVVLFAGGIFLWRQIVRMKGPALKDADAGQPPVTPASEIMSMDAATPAGEADNPDDDYARKLDEELAKYG